MILRHWLSAARVNADEAYYHSIYPTLFENETNTMARINATLADVSMTIQAMPEEEYEIKIDKITSGKSKNNSDMLTIESVVTDGDYKGRRLYDYITFTQKNGEPNEAGLRRLKRLIAGTLGEDRANDPDFDTDELLNVMLKAYIIQEESEYQGETTIQNRIKRYITD